jgi:hypothetical protein
MKALLVLLAVTAIAFAASKDFKEYAPAAEKIEKKFIKIQTENAKLHANYKYEFFPVTLFPALCVTPDTLSPFLAQLKIVYTADVNFGVYEFQGEKHAVIAVLNYMGHKERLSETMTYTLFIMKQNPVSKEWIEERDPVSVILVLTEGATYECKKVKK